MLINLPNLQIVIKCQRLQKEYLIEAVSQS